jgi:hypothetical protein
MPGHVETARGRVGWQQQIARRVDVCVCVCNDVDGRIVQTPSVSHMPRGEVTRVQEK